MTQVGQGVTAQRGTLPPLLLRVGEVSQLLGISRSFTYVLLHRGVLGAPVRLGVAIRIPRRNVEALVERLEAGEQLEDLTG